MSQQIACARTRHRQFGVGMSTVLTARARSHARIRNDPVAHWAGVCSSQCALMALHIRVLERALRD